jgi:hypothetical protein
VSSCSGRKSCFSRSFQVVPLLLTSLTCSLHTPSPHPSHGLARKGTVLVTVLELCCRIAAMPFCVLSMESSDCRVRERGGWRGMFRRRGKKKDKAVVVVGVMVMVGRKQQEGGRREREEAKKGETRGRRKHGRLSSAELVREESMPAMQLHPTTTKARAGTDDDDGFGGSGPTPSSPTEETWPSSHSSRK